MLRVLTLIAALAMLLSGCAPTPPLESKSATNAGSVDLSGDWTMRGAGGSPPGQLAGSEEPFRIPKRTSERGQQRPQRGDGTAVSVFLESGRALRITQTEQGLFISFDRAVVEEYTFGENRIVSVGPIEAQRVSGWEGSRFVVETMDKDGARLRESWSLADEGATLVRRIAISRRENEEFSAEQVFDRDQTG